MSHNGTKKARITKIPGPPVGFSIKVEGEPAATFKAAYGARLNALARLGGTRVRQDQLLRAAYSGAPDVLAELGAADLECEKAREAAQEASKLAREAMDDLIRLYGGTPGAERWHLDVDAMMLMHLAWGASTPAPGGTPPQPQAQPPAQSAAPQAETSTPSTVPVSTPIPATS